MIHADTLLWTKRGWLRAEELVIGDIVISYNPLRNCTEYDSIHNIRIDYGFNTLFGIKSHSINLAITPDHPFILVDKVKKIVVRKSMDDVFLTSLRGNKSILYSSPFEPYLQSKEIEDVQWAARVASSFGNSRYMSIELFHELWNIIGDLCGLEAQAWVDMFFHWNVLEGGTYWSKAVRLRNRQVRDMVYHIAPRAGFGARFMPNPKRPASQWIMGLSTQNSPRIFQSNWYRDRVECHVYDVSTKNGNFLARRTNGTFLSPCALV